MSNLTTKQRNALPDSDFCFVSGSGDKKVRLFPVLDASDVMSAAHLIGKSPDPEGTKRCLIGKATAKGWPIPDAWKPGKANHAVPAETLAALFANESMVIRRGKIWEAGEYADVGYAMTPEEVLAATIDFTPVQINSGHPLSPSPLDGLMGELRSMELDIEDGKSVLGEVAIPQWLNELLPEGEIPVSMEWDRRTKRPLGLSIVSDGRVSDAALLAAFAKRHDTPQGQAVMQGIHDRTASAGAVCRQGNTARMSSRHEQAAVQSIHDITAEHGAVCSDSAKGGLSMGPAFYSQPRNPVPPASAQPPARAGEQPRSGLMSLMQWFKNAIGSLPDDADPREAAALFGATIPSQAGAPPAPATPATPSAQGQAATNQSTATPAGAATFSATDREKSLEAELQRERAKGILRDAATFAEKIIGEERAFPNEKEAIVDAYTQAAVDDNRFGVATFANGSTGNRVDVVKRTYEVRPPHQLTTEQLNPDAVRVLFNKQKTPGGQLPEKDRPWTREELDQALGLTTLGTSLLADRQNGAAARS